MDAGQWGTEVEDVCVLWIADSHTESKKAVGAGWAGLEECSLGGEISMVRV